MAQQKLPQGTPGDNLVQKGVPDSSNRQEVVNQRKMYGDRGNPGEFEPLKIKTAHLGQKKMPGGQLNCSRLEGGFLTGKLPVVGTRQGREEKADVEKGRKWKDETSERRVSKSSSKINSGG